MPTRAEVTAYARAQNQIVYSARFKLQRLWRALGAQVWEAGVLRAALDEFFPVLVAQYGDAAATLAADWFEQQAGVRAVLARPVPDDVARAGARSAMDSLFKGNPAQVLANLGVVLDRMVKQPGRDTIRESSHRAGVRWARVPTGAKTCGFCLMLASRGAVYRSEDTADGGRYHGDCDCVATPIRDLSEYPRGYDPDELYMKFAAAQSAADRSGTKATLAELRRQQGIS